MSICIGDFIIKDDKDILYIEDGLTKNNIGRIKLIFLNKDNLELIFHWEIDMKKEMIFEILNTILPYIFKKNENFEINIRKNTFFFEELFYFFGFRFDKDNKYYSLKRNTFFFYAYDFTKEDYISLRNLVGWVPLEDSQYENIIKNSTYKIAIIHQNKVVGIARCITDLSYLYLLCDVMISPLMQGKGIGKKMMQCFIDYIKSKIDKAYAKIYIMSLKGKEGFYKSLGFKEDIATGLSILCEGK